MSNSRDATADSNAGLTVAASQNDQNDTDNDEQPTGISFDDYVRQICDRMNPADHSSGIILHAAKTLCFLLDSDDVGEDAFKPLMQCGGLERLATLLHAPDPTVVEVAAACLVKLSARENRVTALCRRLTSIDDAMTQLVSLLEAPGQRTRLYVAKTLTALAKEGILSRNSVIDAGVVPALCRAVQSAADSDSKDAVEHGRPASEVLIQLVRLVAAVCRHKKPSPCFETIEPLVPLVVNLLHYPDANVQDEACSAISYLNDGPPSRITAVANYGPTPAVLNLLRSGRDSVVFPALRYFANFTIDTTNHRCWCAEEAVENSSRGAVFDLEYVAVYEAGLFPAVVQQVYAPEIGVQRESVWVIANATGAADLAQLRYLMDECNAVEALCHVFSTQKDARICNITLEAVEALLMAGDTLRSSSIRQQREEPLPLFQLPRAPGRGYPYADRLQQLGGDDSLGKLRDHICHTVFLRSVTLMERYFDNVLARQMSLTPREEPVLS